MSECNGCGGPMTAGQELLRSACWDKWEASYLSPAPQEPSADTIQAVREVYRDDRDAMAHGLLQMAQDLAEARRELERVKLFP